MVIKTVPTSVTGDCTYERNRGPCLQKVKDSSHKSTRNSSGIVAINVLRDCAYKYNKGPCLYKSKMVPISITRGYALKCSRAVDINITMDCAYRNQRLYTHKCKGL